MQYNYDDWLHKHFMVKRDFEAEHAVHEHYHEISPHHHEFYELYFFISGKCFRRFFPLKREKCERIPDFDYI